MARKVDTNEFIRMAINKHGDKYDYSKSEYTRGKDNIIIICPKHGGIDVETIEERASEAAWQIYAETILSEHSVDRVAEIIAEKMQEQKAVDIENACQWITEHIDILYEVETIDGEPVASDYIEWCQKRLEAAKEITDSFRKAMEK